MERDTDRLLEAARRNAKAENWADLARFLNISDQRLTNWKTRGIPREVLMDVAERIGTDPYWIRDGGAIPKELLSKEAIELAAEWQTLCEEKRVAYKTLIDSDAKHDESGGTLSTHTNAGTYQK